MSNEKTPLLKKENKKLSAKELLKAKILERKKKASESATVIQKYDGSTKQLSSAQERMWLVSELIGPSAVYNISLALRFDASLNIEALEQAFSLLVSRQEALRTRFEVQQGVAVQVVSEATSVSLPVEQVKDREALIAAWQAERHFCFELDQTSLYRARLVQEADGSYVLMLVMHHIISDGWSLEVFFKELLIGYRHFHGGHALALPELSIQYSDYAHWQRQWMSGERLQQQLRYWHNQLADLPPLLDLPTDFERPEQQSFKGGTVAFSLSKTVTDQLQALSLRHDATLFMTLIASFSLLLARYSGQSSLAIGTPVANRGRREVEDLIGFFVNTLVLRCDIDEAQTFEAMLKDVRETVLQAYSHQDIPFEQLVEVLKPERNLSHGPLFQVMLALQQSASAAPGNQSAQDAKGAQETQGNQEAQETKGTTETQVSMVELDEGEGVARFDLTFNLNETPNGLHGSLEFNKDIFKTERIERLLAHFEVLLTEIATDASQPVANYDFALEEETSGDLGLQHQDDAGFVSFPERFAHQCATQMDAVALTDETGSWTYAELAKRSNVVSQAVQAAIGSSSAPVILLAPASNAWAMGMLGVMQSGASYLVLSPEMPSLRLRWIMEQTQAQCVLTTQDVVQNQRYSRVFEPLDSNVIYLDDPLLQAASQTHPNDEFGFSESRVAGWHLKKQAGQGIDLVPVTHGVISAVLNDLSASPGTPLTKADALSLDYAGLDALSGAVFGALSQGHSLDFANVATDGDSLRILRDKVKGALLNSQRGYVLQPYIDGSQHAWRFAPVGTVGQLFVAGPCVAMPDESGIANPHENTDSQASYDKLLFATGHRVRQLGEGGIEWLPSHTESTATVSSFLLEETRLTQHPAVNETVFVKHADELVAFVESDVSFAAKEEEKESLTLLAQLHQFLQQQSNVTYLPSQIQVMQALPRTAKGKIDYQALLDALAVSDDWRFIAPEGPTEMLLATQWQVLLQQEQVGRDDNFFELGGYSLLASQLVSRIRDVFSVEIPLRTLFEHQTLRNQAQAIDLAQQSGTSMLPSIVSEPYSGPQPLSFAQKRLWFLSHMMEPNAVYNVPVAMHLRGEVNVDALRESLDVIWQRHTSLRTRFGEVNGEGKQWVEPFVPSTLTVDMVADETALKAACLAEHRHCFDLADDELVRVRLFQVEDKKKAGQSEYVLCMTLHHIICDGWSMGVLFRELMHVYRAKARKKDFELPELPIDYCDYSRWQREQLTDEVLAEQVDYWRKQLAGSPPVLDLPTDFPRPAEQSFKGDSLPIELDPSISEAVHALSKSAGMTPFMILISAFAALIGRYAQQDDVVIGTPVANRHRPETEDLIGFFLNSLALRFDLSGNPNFMELLRRTRETTLQAYANQDVPFEQLVEALQPERSLSHSPLFQVSFSLVNNPAQDRDTAGLEVSGLTLDGGAEVSRYDLTLNISDAEHGLVGSLEYNTDIFGSDTLKQWLVHYERLLGNLLEEPGKGIDDISFLSEEDIQGQLGGWNDNATAYPSDECVHRIFERCAEENADVIAIEHQGETMTYGELNSRANRLAHFLKTRDVGADVCVGVCMDRSLDLVVSLLGILKAGGAYVPMDPSYPESRLLDMMEQSQCELVLTESHWLSELEWLSEVANLPMDRDWQDRLLSRFPEENLERDPCESPLNLAYIIYTSGSTGRPKGVMINHDNITSLSCASSTVEVTKDDVVAQAANYAFDAVTYEIWAALLNGAKAVLIDKSTLLQPAQLADQLHASGVSILFITTALFNRITQEAPHCFSKLNKLLFGGEAYSPDAIENAVMQDERANHLLHVYGPTECTTFATGFELTQAQFLADRQAPIGVPLSNNTAYVMHGYSLAPRGAVGELCIGGEGLARGYLNRGGFTADKFMPNPFSDKPGARLYRTGDLVRLRADGVIDFVGRVDHQVKIRGFRIELGEIEELLLSHESVEEVLVLAREDKPGEKRLVAYLVLDKSQAENDGLQSQWAEFLRGNIPDYAIPSAFVVLESMPLNHNGKIDRNRLPQPSETAYALADYIAPQTEVEKQLAHIWETNLGLDRVGIEDNYFAVGGDSIRSISLVSDAKKIGLHFAIKDLFANPTISALSKVLEVGEAETDEDKDIAAFSLISEESRARLPAQINGLNVEDAYPLSMLQQGMIFHSMQKPELSIYHCVATFNINMPWHEDKFHRALKQLTQRHAILRTVFDLQATDPLQIIVDDSVTQLEVVDLRDTPTDALNQAISAWVLKEKEKGLQLDEPWRTSVHLLPNNAILFALSFHHALWDGWSDASLVSELSAHYQALLNDEPLPALAPPTSYKHFILAEQDALNEPENKAYWDNYLADVQLPWWSGAKQAETQNLFCQIQPEQSQIIQGIADQLNIQEKTVWCGLYMVFLSLIDGRNDVVGSFVTHGRPEVGDADKMIGLFLNSLPIRLDIKNMTWRNVFEAMETMLLEHYAVRQYPLAMIQAQTGLDFGAALFNFTNFHVLSEGKDESEGQALAGFGLDETNYRLSVDIQKNDATGEHACRISADPTAFDDDFRQRLGQYFLAIVEQACANIESKIDKNTLLGDEVYDMAKQACVDPDTVNFPQFHDIVEQQAQRIPDATAILYQDRRLSYAELNQKAEALANRLAAEGVQAEQRIGVCLHRSPEVLIAVLGVLKAGAAYVPIDPSRAEKRIQFICEDSDIERVITTQNIAQNWQDLQLDTLLLDDALTCENWWATYPQREQAHIHTQQLAYILYTSGSTGEPKGVSISHFGLASYVNFAKDAYISDATQSSVVSCLLSFDASVITLFAPLAKGLPVTILPEDDNVIQHIMEKVNSDVPYLFAITPSHIDALGLIAEQTSKTAHIFNLGGEALTSKTLAQFSRYLPNAVFYNEYGPTETVVGCTIFELTDETLNRERAAVPIGVGIANTALYVLDEDLKSVPKGTPGELYISGYGVARGYNKRAGLTAQSFIPNHFNDGYSHRLYKTGDIVRLLNTGDVEYIGRVDEQVQIRGHRVEIGEIEFAIDGIDFVSSSVVLVHPEQQDGTTLVAFVVVNNDAPLPANAEEVIRKTLRNELPTYMVPDSVNVVDHIPLTQSDKVDKKALFALLAPTHQSEAERLASRMTAYPEHQSSLSFWAEHLTQAPVLNLPTDAPRALDAGKRESINFALPKALSKEVEALSLTHGVSQYAVLLSAFGLLMSRYTAQSSLLIGTPTDVATDFSAMPLSAGFDNTLLMPLSTESDNEEMTFVAFLLQNAETIAAVNANKTVPYSVLSDVFTQAQTDLFQVMFSLQYANLEQDDVIELSAPLQHIPGAEVPNQSDMMLRVLNVDEALFGGIEFNSQLFEVESIERLAKHFEALLASIVATPEARLSQLNFLGEQEREALLTQWNQTEQAYASDSHLAAQFEANVEKHANDVAVVDASTQLTYATLNQHANQLAHYLLANGVGPEVRVGVCLERHASLVTSLLAVLKAGGCYVPLDPNYPQARLDYLLSDSDVSVLITDSALAQKLDYTGHVIALDTDWLCQFVNECVHQNQAENATYADYLARLGLALGEMTPEQAVSQVKAALVTNPQDANLVSVHPDNLAYLIYTSGSTGLAKGVSLSHRGALSLLSWAAKEVPAQARAGVLASTSVCFDLSIYELFLPLTQGQSVYLIDSILSLNTYPHRDKLTLINTVPSAAKALLDDNAIPDSVKVLNLAGEPLKANLVDRLYAETHIQQVYDLYGPSEDTTYSTFSQRESHGVESIGHPVANTQRYILDEAGEPVPMGVVGELYLGGDGLARGYWQRPSLSAERFVPNPFSEQPGARLYRTGDLVRSLNDGRLQYVGRVDHQVKVRGFRVEPGEIESLLLTQDSVKDATVIVREDQHLEPQIVAYVIADERVIHTTQAEKAEAQTQWVKSLKAMLQSKLPAYMMPSATLVLDALPLTPNGKLDRNALPAPDMSLCQNTGRGPRTETELALQSQIQTLVDVAQIDIYREFVDLGLHSILLIRLWNQIREHFNVQLSIAELYSYPTVESLALRIDEKMANQEFCLSDEFSLVRVNQSEAPQQMVCIPGAGGEMSQFLDIATNVESDFAAWAVPGVNPAHLTEQTVFHSYADYAESLIPLLAKTQSAEIHLVGHSIGALIAYEMAKVLNQSGAVRVKSLVMLDPPIISELNESASENTAVRLVQTLIPLLIAKGIAPQQEWFQFKSNDDAELKQEAVQLLTQNGIHLSVVDIERMLAEKQHWQNMRFDYREKLLCPDVHIFFAESLTLDEKVPDALLQKRKEEWRRCFATEPSYYLNAGDHFNLLNKENNQQIVNLIKGLGK